MDKSSEWRRRTPRMIWDPLNIVEQKTLGETQIITWRKPTEQPFKTCSSSIIDKNISKISVPENIRRKPWMKQEEVSQNQPCSLFRPTGWKWRSIHEICWMYHKEGGGWWRWIKIWLSHPMRHGVINWSERSVCATCGSWLKRRWPLFLVFFFSFLFLFLFLLLLKPH